VGSRLGDGYTRSATSLSKNAVRYVAAGGSYTVQLSEKCLCHSFVHHVPDRDHMITPASRKSKARGKVKKEQGMHPALSRLGAKALTGRRSATI
jgi:hypothetical protein